MVLALAADGFDMALHGRQLDDDLQRLADEVQALGRRTCTVTGDLADPGGCQRLLDDSEAALGPMGVLVNSAATFPDDRLMTMQATVTGEVLAVDLVSPLVLSQAFASQLPATAHGVIVNMLDQRVLKPTARRFSYTLAKTALWTATRMMARELAPRIRVVGIGPGVAIRDVDMDEEASARLAARAPLGQTGSTEEVVAALRYLLAAGSVTGQMIIVDGGMHIG
jgi:NAD(P)-dependent dehydrogenase (short-subunit alcohol dehydrogenase family)